jgi:hypothetical protein
MKTIQQILAKQDNPPYCKIENGPFMPLVIERIGTGPNGHPAISVAHYYEQNGDLLTDPEMCFEEWDGKLWPYYFKACTGFEQTVYFAREDGAKMIRPTVKRELQQFASIWNRNIREQGFVEAATKIKEAA